MLAKILNCVNDHGNKTLDFFQEIFQAHFRKLSRSKVCFRSQKMS